MSKLLKVKDIQENFGCSKQTAYDMVRLRDFPKLTIGKDTTYQKMSWTNGLVRMLQMKLCYVGINRKRNGLFIAFLFCKKPLE